MRGYGTPMAFKVGLTGDPSAYVLAQDAVSFRWEFRNDSDEMLGRTRIVLIDERGRETRVLSTRRYVLPRAEEGQHEVSTRADAPKGVLRVEVQFEDAVGRSWSRTPGEKLRSLGKRASIQVPDEVDGTWVPVDPANPKVRRFVVNEPPTSSESVSGLEG